MKKNKAISASSTDLVQASTPKKTREERKIDDVVKLFERLEEFEKKKKAKPLKMPKIFYVERGTQMYPETIGTQTEFSFSQGDIILDNMTNQIYHRVRVPDSVSKDVVDLTS